MSTALILAIVVASGQAGSPTIQALLSAASDALRPGDEVRLYEASPPSDAETRRIEAEAMPRAVAQLLWLDEVHERAHLRVHVARTGRWVDREIRFESGDGLSERGRTLGFAVASMLPEADPTLEVSSAPSSEQPEPPAPAPVPPRAVGVALTAVAGIAGPATAVGGDASLSRATGQSVAVRLCAGLRTGALEDVDANELTARAGAGVLWTAVAPTPTRAWGLGAMVDALVVYEAISHTPSMAARAWRSKVLPGADAMLEGSLRLGRDVDVTLAAGAELVLGTIDVTLVSSTATRQVTLPAVRAVSQAGLRLRF